MPPRKLKGQMFVITMIFLIAMVFSVQNLLFNYAEIDLSSPLQNRDSYLVDNIEHAFQQALDSSDDCEEASQNVIDLRNVITSSIKGGQEVRVTGNINCTSSGDWPSSPELTIQVFINSEDGETWADFTLTRT